MEGKQRTRMENDRHQLIIPHGVRSTHERNAPGAVGVVDFQPVLAVWSAEMQIDTSFERRPSTDGRDELDDSTTRFPAFSWSCKTANDINPLAQRQSGRDRRVFASGYPVASRLGRASQSAMTVVAAQRRERTALDTEQTSRRRNRHNDTISGLHV